MSEVILDAVKLKKIFSNHHIRMTLLEKDIEDRKKMNFFNLFRLKTLRIDLVDFMGEQRYIYDSFANEVINMYLEEVKKKKQGRRLFSGRKNV